MRRLVGLVVVFATMGAYAQTANSPSKLALSSAFITGSKTYTVAQLARTIGPHVGQQVTPALLDQLAADIRAQYRQDGYVEPTVVPVDGESPSSTPRLHIFEAHISEIAVRGNPGPYFDAIMKLASPLQSGSIHKDRSRLYLRSIAELPGLTVQATFEPRGVDPSGYTLVLNVTYDAMNATASAHNRGTAELGRTIIGAQTRFNGVLGMQEAVTLFGATAMEGSRYRYVGGRIEKRFGATYGSVEVVDSRAEPDRAWFYSTHLVQAEARTAVFDNGTTRFESLGFLSSRDSHADSFGTNSEVTRTRAIGAGFSGSTATSTSTTRLWSVINQGIDDYGAFASPTQGAAPALSFTTTTLGLIHVKALSPLWQLRCDFDGQWASQDLPVAERFTFGGARFGKAFDPAELIGDSGAALSLQIIRQVGKSIPWLEASRVYMQADYGYAYDNHERVDQEAASITAGVSGRIAALFGSLELSQALETTNQERLGHPRAFFYLQTQF